MLVTEAERGERKAIGFKERRAEGECRKRILDQREKKEGKVLCKGRKR